MSARRGRLPLGSSTAGGVGRRQGTGAGEGLGPETWDEVRGEDPETKVAGVGDWGWDLEKGGWGTETRGEVGDRGRGPDTGVPLRQDKRHVAGTPKGSLVADS